MKLTAEENVFLLKRIQEFFPNNCDLCGVRNWEASDTLFAVSSCPPSSVEMIVVVVTCNHCGNTRFMNAVPLGLIENKTGKRLLISRID